MRVVATLALVGVMMNGAFAQELKVGDPAPSFSGTDDQGRPWKSADHVGKKTLVVYFFPAAMTGG
jgi:peroxiredoxin Q/BCP